MKVRLKRSGGFAGNVHASMPPFEIDSSALPSGRAEELEEKIRDARFFDLPVKSRGPNRLPDAVQYELTVDDGRRSHTIYTDENAAPESLLSFIDWLTDREKEEKKGKNG